MQAQGFAKDGRLTAAVRNKTFGREKPSREVTAVEGKGKTGKHDLLLVKKKVKEFGFNTFYGVIKASP